MIKLIINTTNILYYNVLNLKFTAMKFITKNGEKNSHMSYAEGAYIDLNSETKELTIARITAPKLQYKSV